MSFLDRFKPQPRWKHADPAVRAASIAEIPDDEEHRAVLSELASLDDDVRVRRAAQARIGAVEELVGTDRHRKRRGAAARDCRTAGGDCVSAGES